MFIIEGSNVFIHVQKVFANDVVHRRVVSNNGGIERHLLRDGFTWKFLCTCLDFSK